MIDTSGSTVGQTSYLMTLTVQKLLDTLGEDDFFQVANVSTNLCWALYRASSRAHYSYRHYSYFRLTSYRL